MEAFGIGMQALADAVGSCALAFGTVYVVGFVTKTILIMNDKGTVADFKDWFKFCGKQGL